jgi:hypothetical protein
MAGFTMNLRVDDGASSPLLATALRVKDPATRKVMGRGVANTLRKHFSKLDRQRPNRLGGTRTHFYGQVRRSVQQPVLLGGDGVKVSIPHVGIAQRYFGGKIEPVNVDWLTIPARSEAYGKRAREFNDLDFVLFRPDLAALVQRDQTDVGSGEESGGGVFFWLKKEVEQQPDPTVLPTDAELQTAAVTAGEKYIRTAQERAQEN